MRTCFYTVFVPNETAFEQMRLSPQSEGLLRKTATYRYVSILFCLYKIVLCVCVVCLFVCFFCFFKVWRGCYYWWFLTPQQNGLIYLRNNSKIYSFQEEYFWPIFFLLHTQHNKDERHSSLEKYTSHFIWKGWVWEVVGDGTELQHIDPHSIGHNCISFPFSWAAQPGAWVSLLHLISN